MSTPSRTNANGRPGQVGRGALPPTDRFRAEPLPHPPPDDSFTLADCAKLAVPLCLAAPTFLLGLGSTGTQLAYAVIRGLVRELGALPSSVAYYLIDGAGAPPDMDVKRYFQMRIDGCGTDPKRGYEEFCQRYRHFASVVNTFVLDLFAPDHLLPAPIGARTTTNFWLFSGFGGTSGGALGPAITLLLDVAERRSIQEARIHLVLVGAEMSTRDTSRQLTALQQLVVCDTASCQLAAVSQDFKNARERMEVRPDGTVFERATPFRVYSITLVDQSNGETEFATTDEFIRAMGDAVLLRIATQAGAYVMDRFRDLDVLGDTHRQPSYF